MISTRGRYALRVMIDLAENATDSYTPMKEIAERQKISLKYLERIVPVLVKSGLLEGVHGKSGGYRLTRPLDEYNVGEILRLTEGELLPVACMGLGDEENTCERADNCRTLPMWEGVHKLVNDYFDSIRLSDLIKKDVKDSMENEDE